MLGLNQQPYDYLKMKVSQQWQLDLVETIKLLFDFLKQNCFPM